MGECFVGESAVLVVFVGRPDALDSVSDPVVVTESIARQPDFVAKVVVRDLAAVPLPSHRPSW